MSRTHHCLIALSISLVLVGLAAIAPSALAGKRKQRKRTTKVDYVYNAPTIELNASPTVVSACQGQPAKVHLDARVIFPSGASPRYRWSANAGHIAGTGATTEWDLTGVKPGNYQVFLEADNGATEECSLFSSAMVRINCAPPTCPTISISCPEKLEINEPLTFCANNAGGSPGVRPVYEWSVTAGKIISGEGTSCIEVDTTGLAGQSVRATLNMPGYSDLNCSATCIAQIPNEPPKCRKFDEYSNIPRNDEKARLDNYAIELQNDPTSTAHVVVYPGRNGKAGEVQLHSMRVIDYLVNARAIDKQRITVVVGPTHEGLMITLWVCPQGARSPRLGDTR